MNITIIAAMDKNRLIGINGGLPFRIPEDMRRFRYHTRWNAVIMGRKTFDSLSQIPLPDRLNIVLTHEDKKSSNPSLVFVQDHLEALKACSYAGHTNVFIIGGEEIYRTAMGYANRILLTEINQCTPLEIGQTLTHFPEIPKNFKLIDVDRQGELTFKEYIC